MIPHDWIPSRLVEPSERSPIPIRSVRTPSFLRTLHVLVALGRWAIVTLWQRLVRRSSPERSGRRLREVFERLGTLWIRVGQVLSLRNDVFSAGFCAELARLRDHGFGVPFDDVRRVVEQELGTTLEAAFAEMSATPFTATAISQVHEAVLRREGRRVAVRVQHPHAPGTSARDARVLRWVARVLQRLSIQPNLHWDVFRQEIEQWMTRELDYRYEAASVRELKKNLRRHGVYVHEVFARYSTPRVLVTEFVTGALMSDYVALREADPDRLTRWLDANDIDPQKLAVRLFRSVFRQIFEDNFFHADMHPGNIVLLRGSRFSVLDCRNVGELEKESLTRHRMFFQGLAEGEYATAADLYLLLASTLPAVDVAEVKAQLVRLWRSWQTRSHVRELPYAERSISGMLGKVNDVTYRYRFASRWLLTRLARTWANLDASLELLHPRMQCRREMARYFRKAGRRRTRAVVRAVPRKAPGRLVGLVELPKQLSDAMHFREAIVRRQAQVFQGSTGKAGAVIGAGFGAAGLFLSLAMAVALGALVQQCLDVSVRPVAGPQLGAIVAHVPRLGAVPWALVVGALVFLHRRCARLRKRFELAAARVPEVRASV